MASGVASVVSRVTSAARDQAADGAGLLGDAAGLGARAARCPSRARGLAVEATRLAVRAAVYPSRVLAGQQRRHLGEPAAADRTAARRYSVGSLPVVLVHGMCDNSSAFGELARSLRRHGFHDLHAINYDTRATLTGDVAHAAARLAAHIESVCAQTGAAEVHVVGHSLGGLIARYYVQRINGDRRVHTLVTLGTPHHGTLAAYLLPTRMARQLRPGSPLLAELARPAPSCRTAFVAVWSDADQVIVPRQNARLQHPDLIVSQSQIHDLGHLSLLVDARAQHAVITALTASADQCIDPPLGRGDQRAA